MACRFGALSDPIAALEHAPRNPWRDYGSLMRKDILTSWPGVSTSAKDGVAGQVAVAGVAGQQARRVVFLVRRQPDCAF